VKGSLGKAVKTTGKGQLPVTDQWQALHDMLHMQCCTVL
jgi:hypothetical protein